MPSSTLEDMHTKNLCPNMDRDFGRGMFFTNSYSSQVQRLSLSEYGQRLSGNGEKYIYHFVHIYVQKCTYICTFQFILFEGILWGYRLGVAHISMLKALKIQFFSF